MHSSFVLQPSLQPAIQPFAFSPEQALPVPSCSLQQAFPSPIPSCSLQQDFPAPACSTHIAFCSGVHPTESQYAAHCSLVMLMHFSMSHFGFMAIPPLQQSPCISISIPHS